MTLHCIIAWRWYKCCIHFQEMKSWNPILILWKEDHQMYSCTLQSSSPCLTHVKNIKISPVWQMPYVYLFTSFIGKLSFTFNSAIDLRVVIMWPSTPFEARIRKICLMNQQTNSRRVSNMVSLMVGRRLMKVTWLPCATDWLNEWPNYAATVM